MSENPACGFDKAVKRAAIGRAEAFRVDGAPVFDAANSAL